MSRRMAILTYTVISTLVKYIMTRISHNRIP